MNNDLFERLGASFLNPQREAEAEVRAAVGKTQDKRVAWERLSARGLLPDWLFSDAERRFAREPWPDIVPKWPVAERSDEIPTSIEGLVTIASDPPGILAAEQSGREWYARWARLKNYEPRLNGVVWRVLSRASRRWGGLGIEHSDTVHIRFEAERGMMRVDGVSSGPDDWREPPLIRSTWRRAREAIAIALGSANVQGIVRRFRADPVSLLESTLTNAIFMDAAAAAGATMEPGARWPGVAEATRFASIPNLFAPALDVYAGGYAVADAYRPSVSEWNHRPDLAAGVWLVLAAPAASGDRMPASAR